MVLLLLTRTRHSGHDLDSLLLDAGNLVKNWVLVQFSPISTGSVLETPPGHESLIRSRGETSRWILFDGVGMARIERFGLIQQKSRVAER